jgi:hypothetical protein
LGARLELLTCSHDTNLEVGFLVVPQRFKALIPSVTSPF